MTAGGPHDRDGVAAPTDELERLSRALALVNACVRATVRASTSRR
jgi:hypothetical protein